MYFLLCVGRDEQESQTLQKSKPLCAKLFRCYLDQTLVYFMRRNNYNKKPNPSAKIEDQEKIKENAIEGK